jgi:putative hemolysin
MASAELLVSTTDGKETDRPHYSLLVAKDSAEVRAAQQLRHQVFAGEMGATLHSTTEGTDADRFDEFCDHLVVRDDATGEIVGTYRMLPPERAKAAGRMYSDDEFDLSALDPIRSEIVETGRSCVHPDHRGGSVIGLVWAGIARYMFLSGHKYLAGCASVPVTDGGALAAGVWDTVSAKNLSDPSRRVHPKIAWDVDAAPRPDKNVIPPLLRGYLRLGAEVCGRPAWDEDFGVADFFVLLSLDRIDTRYLKFFLGETG